MANLTKAARRDPGDKMKLPTGYHRTQAQPQKAPPGTSPAARPLFWVKPAWLPLMSLCPSPTAKKPRGKDERETNPLSPATSPATKELREESLPVETRRHQPPPWATASRGLQKWSWPGSAGKGSLKIHPSLTRRNCGTAAESRAASHRQNRRPRDTGPTPGSRALK